VFAAAAVADDDDDVNVLNGEESCTVGLNVRPRTVRFQRWKCFTAKKLMLYLDLSALRVSYGIIGLT